MKKKHYSHSTTYDVWDVDAGVVLTSNDAEAESFAGFLDQVEREDLVEVLVVSEAGQSFVAVDGQKHHARRLS